MSVDYVEQFPSFAYDRPRDGVLRITLDAPGLNAVNLAAHGELGAIWPVIDRDPEVSGGDCAGGQQGVLGQRRF